VPRGTQASDIYSLGMVLYQVLYRVEPFHERSKSAKSKTDFLSTITLSTINDKPKNMSMQFAELLKMLAMTNDDDQFLRPSFPSGVADGSNYNLQLLSGIEACWLELPEMRPNIKKIRTIISSNMKSTCVFHQTIRTQHLLSVAKARW
jgi:hypothetical protein